MRARRIIGPLVSAPCTSILGAPGQAQDIHIGVLVGGAPAIEDQTGVLSGAELDLASRFLSISISLLIPIIATILGPVEQRIAPPPGLEHFSVHHSLLLADRPIPILVLVLGVELALGALAVGVAHERDDGLLLALAAVLRVLVEAALQGEA